MEAYYFTATWCQPCKVFGPVMENIGKDFEVKKIDIEEDIDKAVALGVLSVPTVIFVDSGYEELGRFVGARTEKWVRDFIGELKN